MIQLLMRCSRWRAQARDRRYLSAAALLQLAPASLGASLDVIVRELGEARDVLLAPAEEESGVGRSAMCAFPFASLPAAIALHDCSLVPADARARATLVCRAWRASVATRSLWTRLDLSPASGVRHPVSDTVLRGAAALAGGELVSLNLGDCTALT